MLFYGEKSAGDYLSCREREERKKPILIHHPPRQKIPFEKCGEIFFSPPFFPSVFWGPFFVKEEGPKCAPHIRAKKRLETSRVEPPAKMSAEILTCKGGRRRRGNFMHVRSFGICETQADEANNEV